ncbi:MAG TPA: hypothetical protein VFQ80_08510, partial [Thermomicrobiales bacterium]|nr:hypothetical protein [Thermomicrobiales bacterium]
MRPRQAVRRIIAPFARAAPALLALALLVALSAPAVAAPAGLPAAVVWLTGQQQADGGFPGFSGASDPGATTDAAIALGAARQAGIEVDRPLAAALSYLAKNEQGYAAAGSGQQAKLVLAAVAAGLAPDAFGGLHPAASPAAGAPAGATPAVAIPGLYGDDLFDHALVVLAMAAGGEPIPPAAIDVLRQTQQPGGGWATDGSADAAKSDSNTTALVVQALVAAGQGDEPMVGKALTALKGWQTPDGGFAFATADPLVADANSTAFGVQAIVAVGQDPASTDWRDAAVALARFQNPSGAFRYTDAEAADNLFATLQAIPA